MPVKMNESLCEELFFNRFFKEHAKGLRNFLLSKFGNQDLAEDIVQESFIKIWNNCKKIEVKKAKNYLFTVAVNMGVSDKRHEQVKFKHHEFIVSTFSGANYENPEFVMEEQEFLEKFKRSIAALPDRQREVFLLSRIEQKTYKEIAELSNVSVKAIEKLMHKALIKLRETIGNV